jgi:thioredoxin 1
MQIKVFSSKFCGPCKRYNPVLSSIINDNPDVSVVKIDTDDPGSRQLCIENEIRVVPTTFVYNDNGDLITKFTGYKSIDQMQKLIESNSND